MKNSAIGLTREWQGERGKDDLGENMDLYEIEWNDAAGISGWFDKETLDFDGMLSRCFTVGYLVKVAPSCVVLSRGHNDGGYLMDVVAIPRYAIVKARKL